MMPHGLVLSCPCCKLSPLVIDSQSTHQGCCQAEESATLLLQLVAQQVAPNSYCNYRGSNEQSLWGLLEAQGGIL